MKCSARDSEFEPRRPTKEIKDLHSLLDINAALYIRRFSNIPAALFHFWSQ